MNSKSRLTKLFALSLTILALAIPAVAAAGPVGPTLGEYHAPPADSATVVSAEPGFDWGDAAIGASIAMALVVIGAGGVLVAKALREDRTRFRVIG